MIGYIYAIYGVNSCGDILTYYGSTINFYARKKQHLNSGSRSILVDKIMTECYNNWVIKIVEKVIYNEYIELLIRETEYIQNHKCINIKLPVVKYGEPYLKYISTLIIETELPSTSELIYF